MKVVINKSYGGFGLSKRATRMMELLLPDESQFNVDRSDPYLVKIVEYLGEAASSEFSELRIVEIPDGVKWHIEEYDGKEWVAEDHRTWG